MKVIGGHIYSNGTRWSAETPSGETADFALFSTAQFWLDMDRYLSTPSTNSRHIDSNPIEDTNFLGEQTNELQEGFDGFQEKEEPGHPWLGVATIEDGLSDGSEIFGAPSLGTEEVLCSDVSIHCQNPGL